MSAEQLHVVEHENRPRRKWLCYLEDGCEKKRTLLEVVGSGDCRNMGSMCPWASRLNVFVAPRLEIKEAGSCGGLVFVEGVKSMEDEEAVAEV